MWNQDLYQKAWNFACKAHKNQFMPRSDIPYSNHLGNVTMEVLCLLREEKFDDETLLILCAMLHDTIEDTEITFEEIEENFGSSVAKGVMALSKNKNLISKNEQILDSLKRIKNEPKEIWAVKMADRITNLQKPPQHWNKEKILNYRNEAIIILENLGTSSKYLSKRLKNKINEYEVYIKELI